MSILMFESTGVLKTALWRPTVFLELQSSGTTSRLSPKIGPVIGLSVAVGCQLSGGPENHPGERDHFASESEMSPQIGLNGAVSGPRSGGLPEAPEEAYSRGYCLIVNNFDFTSRYLSNRTGTHMDAESLRRVFSWLGFQVEVVQDATRDQMLSSMEKLARRDHRGMDCVACVVLSHGREGGVYGVDGKSVQLEKLKGYVNGEQCGYLIGKPKLFFIQACQGIEEEKAVPVPADGPVNPKVHAQTDGPSGPGVHAQTDGPSGPGVHAQTDGPSGPGVHAQTDGPSGPGVHAQTDGPCSSGDIRSNFASANSSIPITADFLTAMATTPSCVSCRDRKKGAWFIQSLCKNLIRLVPRNTDLLSILTEVNNDSLKSFLPVCPPPSQSAHQSVAPRAHFQLVNFGTI
ncbi:unnamed protein product [Boreogadus saida]